MTDDQMRQDGVKVANARLTMLLVLDLLITFAISLLLDMAFWHAVLLIAGIRIALWAIKAVKELACVLAFESGTDVAARQGEYLKDMGYPPSDGLDRTIGGYLHSVSVDKTLDPEVRIDATAAEFELHRNSGFFTVPARLLMDHYAAKRYEIIKRVLA